MKRVIFYYQTFVGLKEILKQNPDVTHIHLSSIHFGTEDDSQPYIHLNNNHPDSSMFKDVWNDLDHAAALGIKVILMIGGAGNGYSSLFSNYDTHYSQLHRLFHTHSCLSGIDFDIEEQVDLNDVKKVMFDFKKDFPLYTISFAPIQSSLQIDEPGMGGFIYKDLYSSEYGKIIDYFNVQFYSDFSVEAYDQIVTNGYPPSMIVMGSINGSGSIDTVYRLCKKYSGFGGVFSWEYFSTIPAPQDWAYAMKNIQSTFYQIFTTLLPCFKK
jgi:hypothetical protein